MDVNNSEHAGAAFLEVAERGAGIQRTELQLRAVTEYLRGGYIDRGLATVRDVLRSMGLRLPRTRAGTLWLYLRNLLLIRIRGLRYRTTDERDLSPAVRCRIDTCMSLAAGFAVVDCVRGAGFLMLSLRYALAAGEPRRLAHTLALQIIALAMQAGGNPRRLAKMRSHILRLKGGGHAPEIRDFIGGVHSQCECVAAVLLTDFSGAIRHADAAIPLLRTRCTGAWWELSSTIYFRALSLVYVGRLGELRDDVDVVRAEAVDRGATCRTPATATTIRS